MHRCFAIEVLINSKPRLPVSSSFLTFLILRSVRPKVFCKKGVLKNFAKFTGKFSKGRLEITTEGRLNLDSFPNLVKGKKLSQEKIDRFSRNLW